MMLALALLAVFTQAQTVCVVPASIATGYTWTTSAGTALTACDSDTCSSPTGLGDLACAATYAGTATVTGCTVSAADAVVSGCAALQCKTPAAVPTGYVYTATAVDTDITGCTSVACTGITAPTCDTGYAASSPAIGACSTTDDDAVFSGCAALQCKTPAAVPTGYVYTATAVDTDITGCTSAACTGITAPTCDTLYAASSPAIGSCSTTDDDAVFSGCAALACKTPAAIPTGYAYGVAVDTAITSCSSVDCSGATAPTCAALYAGTPAIAACSTTDDDAVFSGCSLQCKSPAAVPTGYAYGTTDTDIADCTAAACTGTAPTCAALYAGTPAIASCSSSDDDAVFSGCSLQCKSPAVTPTGYVYGTTDTDIADCTAAACTGTAPTCATGYTGTPAIASCSSSDDDAVFSGCTMAATTTTVDPDDSALTVGIAIAATIALAMF